MALKWKRTGAYTLEIEGWIIAKCYVGEGVKYVLTNNGKWVGNFESAEAAQLAANGKGQALHGSSARV